MSQLGTLMAGLSGIRFDKIGSLFDDRNGGWTVGECLSPSLVWFGRDELEVHRGPFEDESSYLKAMVSAFTSQAQDLPITYHSFFAPEPALLEYSSPESRKAALKRWSEYMAIGQKTDNSKNRLAFCIAGQLLQEMIPHLTSGVHDGPPFTLLHQDLHRGNIYVDETFNITCIIDWSSASTGPMSELLMLQCFSKLTSEREESLVSAFRTTFEQGRAGERASLSPWVKAEPMWHFSKFVRMSTRADCEHFMRLYDLVYNTATGYRDATTANVIVRLFHDRANQAMNKQLLAKLQEDDLVGEELHEDEKMHFPRDKKKACSRVAVARKLILMSEMNPYFFPDLRLWRWVEEALAEDDGA